MLNSTERGRRSSLDSATEHFAAQWQIFSAIWRVVDAREPHKYHHKVAHTETIPKRCCQLIYSPKMIQVSVGKLYFVFVKRADQHVCGQLIQKTNDQNFRNDPRVLYRAPAAHHFRSDRNSQKNYCFTCHWECNSCFMRLPQSIWTDTKPC